MQQAKYAADASAVAVGGLAFFKMIPWPEIAGFLSAIWLTIQIGTWSYKKVWPIVRHYFK